MPYPPEGAGRTWYFFPGTNCVQVTSPCGRKPSVTGPAECASKSSSARLSPSEGLTALDIIGFSRASSIPWAPADAASAATALGADEALASASTVGTAAGGLDKVGSEYESNAPG